MKTIILILASLFIFGCASIPPHDGGPVTTTTQAPVVVEPGFPPKRLTEYGLKVGECKIRSDRKIYVVDSWHGTPAPCLGSPQAGDKCTQSGLVCSSGGVKLRCDQTAPLVCNGWVYEKDVPSLVMKPLKDAKVDLWWMPGCMVGMCEPLVKAVTTNEFGYYEISGVNVPISTNVRAYKDGFYGVCSGGKPYCAAGICSTGDTYEDHGEIEPIPLMKITETSCK